MKEFNLESTKYITLDNKVWILPSSVAKLKGKGNGNYNNWLLTGCTNFLLGDELRLIKDSPRRKKQVTTLVEWYQFPTKGKHVPH